MRVKIVAAIALVVTLCIALVAYLLMKYPSAFEADQACHFDLAIYPSQKNLLGCDHDLETRQWLLFESGVDGSSAKVLKRYRY